MLRIVVAFSFAWLCTAAPAQSSLNELQRQFQSERRQLAASSPTDEQRVELLGRQIRRLEAFVGDAKGDDRWNARLMLADFQLMQRNREAAARTLSGIDPAAAKALLLVTAATMAKHLGLDDKAAAWVAAAMSKPAPVDDQLAMARLLQLVLHEVDRSEQIFQQALAAAADDEGRAYVRWHRADVMRDREDLPDNAGFEEFDKLAKDLPATYWGSVARDRLRATELKPGADAIEFRGKTRDGADFTVAGCRGKALVLAFWSSDDYDTPTLVGKLRELRSNLGKDLVVLGICLDTDEAEIKQAIADLGIDFPVIGDGAGPRLDAALRWGVEGPVVHVIDKLGKVAGFGLHVGTADARAEFLDIVRQAAK